MQNDEGVNVDLYIPRKCSATNRLIPANDHASVQINVGHVNAQGVYTGETTSFALCGFIRKTGRGDEAVNRLATEAGFLAHTYKF
uniref:40S ribosomal protein S21 n=1 Tax=Arcella intermedia TaxID=1963864 RepID=A0A6B2LWA4_9EUKA